MGSVRGERYSVILAPPAVISTIIRVYTHGWVGGSYSQPDRGMRDFLVRLAEIRSIWFLNVFNNRGADQPPEEAQTRPEIASLYD